MTQPRSSRHVPVRTCVGCRRTVAASELLRVVVAPSTSVPPGGPAATDPTAVPDPRRRAGGRGAWVHPDLRCVEVAQRRRAFARALRVPGLDPAPVRSHVAGLQDQHDEHQHGQQHDQLETRSVRTPGETTVR